MQIRSKVDLVKDRWNWISGVLVAALALAASMTSIVNKFAYDDRYIVELNPVMRSMRGWWQVFQNPYWPKDWGGDGYRPLTILAFKIEWVLSGGKPFLFHATNIVLYAFVSLLVFLIARRILPLWAAWISAALFAVHPVHVEAVANVVGQSELLVAASILGATLLYLADRQRGELRMSTVGAIASLYALACFSKEHGIVLPAILLACELTVVHDSASLRSRILAQRWLYLMLGSVAIAFVLVRSAVLSDHPFAGFHPFTPFAALHISHRDRVLTALGVVPQWVRLLYWPAHLSTEYGPPAIEIAQGPSLTQLPGLIVLASIVGVGVLARRRNPVTAFGVAFTCITLLPSSNFVLPAGILLAERTLFLPSVGAMFIVGAAAAYAGSVAQRRASVRTFALAGGVACAALLAVAAMRSARRSRVWYDSETVFRQGVADAPLAYRAHFMLGAWAFENQRQREGERELRRALSLFPYDPFVAFDLAENYRQSDRCGAAVPMYRWIMGMDKNFPLGHTSFSICLLETGNYSEAKAKALDALRRGGDTVALRRVISLADSAIVAREGKVFTGQVAPVRAPSKLPESVQKAGETASVSGKK
jgi:hypothetical protein